MARKRKARAEAAVNDENEAPLTEKDKKALKKIKKQEADLEMITEANKTRFREAAAAHNEMTTEPERKPAMDVDDDMKLAFNVGEYVKVLGDTSANMNHPDGYGFVQEANGVGAATIPSSMMLPLMVAVCIERSHSRR